MYKIIFLIAVSILFAGCRSLESKGVVMKTDIYGLRFTGGADPASGAVTPGIMAGGMSSVVFTLPQGEGSTLEYEEKGFSFWGWILGNSGESGWKLKLKTGKADDEAKADEAKADEGKADEAKADEAKADASVTDANFVDIQTSGNADFNIKTDDKFVTVTKQ